MDPIRQKIESLRQQLHEHNYNYYVLSNPIISDREYDRMMQQLTELEAQYPGWYDPNSPTMRVGSESTRTSPR